MAVNTLGQILQIVPVSAPGNDLTLGLKLGDVLQGKLVDILPDNRAIIQIKGLNLLAQLPETQNGQQFNRGMILDLAVTQAQPNSPSAAAGSNSQSSVSSSSPALTLKLTDISPQGSTANQISQAGLDQTEGSLPPMSLELLLGQAKLPVTSANLQAAQSLSRYGLPVDAASLNDLIQTATTLSNVENSVSTSKLPAPAANLPQSIQESLNDAKTLLNVLISQNGTGVDRPAIQGILEQIKQLEVQSNTEAPSASNPSKFQNIQEVLTALNQNLNQISDGSSQALQNFSQLLGSLQGELSTSLGAETDPPALAMAESAPSTTSASTPLSQATVTLQREVAAVLMQSLAPILETSTINQADILTALNQLSSNVSVSSSAQAEQILASSNFQNSGFQNSVAGLSSAPTEGLANLQASIGSIQEAFNETPLANPLRSLSALSLEFNSRGLPSPKIALSSLPLESVIEAVAFLKARGVPPSRPAVEAVASQLNEGQDLGSQMGQILNSSQNLPEGFLELQPPLQQAMSSLNLFLNQNGIQPDANDVANQMHAFVLNSGLNLERSLAPNSAISESRLPTSNAGAMAKSDPAESLKGNLLRLQDALQEATQHPVAQASPELSSQLVELSSHVNSAINAMHTLQLAARPTPAFDVTTIQLPVYLGGPLGSGQLSVYWKKGRPHEINEQDPVNVVFLLNTRGLGDVKVQLQVWKQDCQCRVSVGSEESRNFLRAEAPAFEKSFAQNTPFKLSTLDISGSSGPLKRALDFSDDGASRSGTGLNLTA